MGKKKNNKGRGLTDNEKRCIDNLVKSNNPSDFELLVIELLAQGVNVNEITKHLGEFDRSEFRRPYSSKASRIESFFSRLMRICDRETIGFSRGIYENRLPNYRSFTPKKDEKRKTQHFRVEITAQLRPEGCQINTVRLLKEFELALSQILEKYGLRRERVALRASQYPCDNCDSTLGSLHQESERNSREFDWESLYVPRQRKKQK